MTATSWRTPIYTRRELADLVAAHDCEHPGHETDCSCRHGLIAAARVLLVSTRRRPVPVVPEPRPYVPPDVVRGTIVGTGGRDR